MSAVRILYKPIKRKPLSKKEFEEKVALIRKNMSSQVSAFVDETPEAREKRKAECKQDFEKFKMTYLPHYFFKPSGKFHAELHELCNTGNKSIIPIAIPREHGKSVNCSFAEFIHKAVYLLSRYEILISDALDLAEEFLFWIKLEFEENERLRGDFGRNGELKTEGWWMKNDIVITTSEGQARIRAMGAGMKIRGTRFMMWRPDYIDIDDLENDINVKNKKLVKERLQWILSAVYGSLSDDGTLVMVGTILDKISVLMLLIEHVREKKSKIEKNFGVKAMHWVIYSAIKEDGTPLWPEGKSLQKLLQIKEMVGEVIWQREFMNKPIDEGIFKFEYMKDFDREIIIYPNTQYSFFSGSDPSASDSETSDYKAHVIVAKHPEKPKWYVVDAWIRRDTPMGMIQKFIEFYRVYHMAASEFESNGYQVLLKTEMEKICLEMGIFPTIIPIVHTTNKIARISSLQGMVERQEIMFDKDIPDVETLVYQLNALGGKGHDDGPDAFHMAMEVSKSCSGDFSFSSTGKRAFAGRERETSMGNQRFAAGLRNDFMGVHY